MRLLRELRKNAGLSLREFGDLFGIGESTVSQYETGKREPSYGMLCRFADYFHVSTDRLLGREDRGAPDRAEIPVLGSVAAGIPVEAVEDIVGSEPISRQMSRRGEYFALRIRGSSMEPVLLEGDIVIVRRQPDAESGDTVVAIAGDGDATCKKLAKYENGIALLPHNPAFAPLFFPADRPEGMGVAILGKVVEMRRKM
jgi:repressor LexA